RRILSHVLDPFAVDEDRAPVAQTFHKFRAGPNTHSHQWLHLMFDGRHSRSVPASADVKDPPSGRPALLHHLAKNVLDPRFVRREIIASARPTQFELTTDY